jgi:hypothetical protein
MRCSTITIATVAPDSQRLARQHQQITKGNYVRTFFPLLKLYKYTTLGNENVMMGAVMLLIQKMEMRLLQHQVRQSEYAIMTAYVLSCLLLNLKGI